MAVLLFSLRGVPEDEAFEVRALLSENEIDFYETSAGNWGISTHALWLKDDSQESTARELIAHYQTQRSESQRAQYQLLKQRGEHLTLWRSFKQKPVHFISYIALIYMVLYFSVKVIQEMNA